MRFRFATGPVAFSLLVAFGLAGCGGERSEDTTCAEYLEMSAQEQRAAVSEAFEDEEPPGTMSDMPYSQAALYAACLVDGQTTLYDVVRVDR